MVGMDWNTRSSSFEYIFLSANKYFILHTYKMVANKTNKNSFIYMAPFIGRWLCFGMPPTKRFISFMDILYHYRNTNARGHYLRFCWPSLTITALHSQLLCCLIINGSVQRIDMVDGAEQILFVRFLFRDSDSCLCASLRRNRAKWEPAHTLDPFH